MAKKKEEKDVKAVAKTLQLEPIKKTLIKVTLKGTSPLILNKKARSFERAEVWKQTHPRGEKIPDSLNQNYCLWEKLITSISWRDPIVFHDDDWSKYTQEEWLDYMENNAPCISSQAIFGAMREAFISFGYKEKTGKNGTDMYRGVSFTHTQYPIRFTEAHYEQKLIPNQTKQKTNVIGQYNYFTDWECDVLIMCVDVAFSPNVIIDLLRVAGQFIGISTQHHNNFGRFDLANLLTEDMK